MTTFTSPRVEDAATELARLDTPALAALAGLDPAAVDAGTGAALRAVRADVCETARCDVEDLGENASEDFAVNADHDYPGTLVPARRLAAALTREILAARNEECRTCGGTGEAWFDVETASGRVVEDMVACYCGGV